MWALTALFALLALLFLFTRVFRSLSSPPLLLLLCSLYRFLALLFLAYNLLHSVYAVYENYRWRMGDNSGPWGIVFLFLYVLNLCMIPISCEVNGLSKQAQQRVRVKE